MKLDRSWFIKSREGNIKDTYFFEKKLGSGGYGAVYLARNKETGKISKYREFKFNVLYHFHRWQSCSQGHVEGQDYRLHSLPEWNQHSHATRKSTHPCLNAVYYCKPVLVWASNEVHSCVIDLILVMAVQDHPNIIKLHETWETERICFLVTE